MTPRIWTLKTILDRCIEEGDCWIWQQSLTNEGYPQACVEGKRATRIRGLAYQLAGKVRQPGFHLVMECANRRCCNPKHMVQKTQSQIREIAHAAGKYSSASRYLRGVRHMRELNLSKLDFEKARELRRRLSLGETPAALAKEYGVSTSAIWRVRQGVTYREPFGATA
jgi:hypothetical protein